MLRTSGCFVLALLVAGCGGPDGDLAQSRQAAQAARIVKVAELRDPSQGGKYGFGRVLALADGTLAVSEPVNYTGAAHVHVYGRSGAAWVHETSLTAPAGETWSGWTVAAAPGKVAVGSGAATPPGSVHVYERTKAGWSRTATIVAPPEATHFGASLAMTGQRLLAGGSVGFRGAVWSFERTATGAWIPTGEIASPFVHDYDEWGASMALSGDRAVISDPSVRWIPSFNGGVAVFDRGVAQWELTACIEEPEADVGFGRRVDASGRTVAISGFTGMSTHVWDVGDTTEQSEQVELDDSAAEPAFGEAVALGNGFLVVSAGGSVENGISAVGSVYVYLKTAEGWSAPTLLHSDEATGGWELFGRGLAVSGSFIAVGAPGAEEVGDEEAYGEVYVYEVKAGAR